MQTHKHSKSEFMLYTEQTTLTLTMDLPFKRLSSTHVDRRGSSQSIFNSTISLNHALRSCERTVYCTFQDARTCRKNSSCMSVSCAKSEAISSGRQSLFYSSCSGVKIDCCVLNTKIQFVCDRSLYEPKENSTLPSADTPCWYT